MTDTQFAYWTGQDPAKDNVTIQPPMIVVVHPFEAIPKVDIEKLAEHGYTVKQYETPDQTRFVTRDAVASKMRSYRNPWLGRLRRRK